VEAKLPLVQNTSFLVTNLTSFRVEKNFHLWNLSYFFPLPWRGRLGGLSRASKVIISKMGNFVKQKFRILQLFSNPIIDGT
jgi:hypothetical protein